jgi:glutathione S-transferase
MSEATTKPSDLSLYQTAWCPFCVRVRGALENLGVDVELRDVSESREHLQELTQATGSQMVPCLRIEAEGGPSQWMHESRDIIAYLMSRFAA